MHKITGKIELLQDSNGSDYLALSVDEETVLPYIKFLATQVPICFIENQKKRDNSHHHVTLLNTGQYGYVKKHNPDILDLMIREFQEQEPIFYSHGIGSVKGTKKQNKEQIANGEAPESIEAFFMVLANDSIDNLRKKYLPDWNLHHLHCTLAFDKNDVHGPDVNKGVESLIHEDEKILNTRILSKLK